jgi:hypothetical protein
MCVAQAGDDCQLPGLNHHLPIRTEVAADFCKSESENAAARALKGSHVRYEMIAVWTNLRSKVQMSEHENRQFVEQSCANLKADEIPTLLQSITCQLSEVENVPFAGKRQEPVAVGEFFPTFVAA